MQQVGTYMDEIKRRVQLIRQDLKDRSPSNERHFRCEKCKDAEWIWTGWEAARPCECQQQRKYERRLNYAMIPDDFKDSTFESYVQETDMQRAMFDHISNYLYRFEEIRTTQKNSLGFIADYGETRLSEMNVSKHSPQYNSYGLGKTHLKIAAAKWLIEKGHTVFIVKDVALMDELTNARRIDDGGEQYNRILSRVIDAPVLIWDDLGKSNPTQAKQRIYFHIFDERSQKRRPVIFSSNEDVETISDRIGGASWSRLYGMSDVMATVGPDYRAMGA